MKWLIGKALLWPDWLRVLTASFAFSLVTFLTILVSISLTVNYAGGTWLYFGLALSLFLIVMILVFLVKYIQYAYAQVLGEEKQKESVIMYAHSLVQRQASECQETIKEKYDIINDANTTGQIALKNIKGLTEKIHTVFESKYGESQKQENRINFEVTFMTKSYIDEGITIPAFSNREKRAPISMTQRQENIGLYNNTVTAFIYREAKPTIHIIENTNNAEDYAELYAGQKARIKSSIVYPVLSPENNVMGTIVVHCDKENFFKGEDGKYWKEVLEIFSKQMGIDKIVLDLLAEKQGIKLF